MQSGINMKPYFSSSSMEEIDKFPNFNNALSLESCKNWLSSTKKKKNYKINKKNKENVK